MLAGKSPFQTLLPFIIINGQQAARAMKCFSSSEHQHGRPLVIKKVNVVKWKCVHSNVKVVLQFAFVDHEIKIMPGFLAQLRWLAICVRNVFVYISHKHSIFTLGCDYELSHYFTQ
jgi:hypothetical protein